MTTQVRADLSGDESRQLAAYDTLVYNLFQAPRKGRSTSAIIAFTSALQGEGVTEVVRSVFDVVEANSSAKSIHVTMDWLKRQPTDASTTPRPEIASSSSVWNSTWENRNRIVQQLRSRFRYVGIDCPSLAMSSDVLSLAPLVDGVVLVVEAERTTKAQIRNAERQIEAAGGEILGLILNKRRYHVPAALYHHL